MTVVFVLALVLGGCGDDGSAQDGGPDAGDARAGPAEPAAPRFEPCPAGWSIVDADGVPVCEPWPASGPASCPDGEAHFPGEPGCAPIGAPCPASGDFAEGLPDDATVSFVRAGAGRGGDGTRASPFGTIRQASDAARPGTTVALAAGVYREPVYLHNGVTLRGACVALTRIESDAPPAGLGVVKIGGFDVVVRDLTIAGGPGAVFAVPSTPELPIGGHLEGVLITASRGAAVYLESGRLTADRLVIRGVDVEPTDLDPNRSGFGIEVGTGTSAEIHHAVVEGATYAGARVFGPGARLLLADSVVRGTRTSPNGLNGFGLEVVAGASAEATRTVFEQNHDVGVLTDASTVLRDVVVRDVAPNSAGSFGRGIESNGGSLVLERVRVERVLDLGIALGIGPSVTASDLLIRDVVPRTFDGTFGRAIDVDQGASLDLTRALIVRSHDIAVHIVHSGTSVRMTDVVVRDTDGDTGGAFGRGLDVERGATVTAERIRFEGQRDVGVAVFGAGTRVTLVDAVIRGTAPVRCSAGDCPGGTGAGVFDEGALELTRFLIEGNALCGAQLARGGQLDLHQGEVCRNLIGACVQSEGYDLARLTDRVVFCENASEIDSADRTIPLPGL